MASEETNSATTPQSALFTVTPKAAEMVRKYASQEGKGDKLRVQVMPGGCAGYSYGLDFADAPEPDDITVESNGVTLYINEDILPLVQGAKLDFVESLMGSGFTFDNPNATKGCGCGKSFQ